MDNNPQVEFERYFKNQIGLWTQADLELEGEDCGKSSSEVSHHKFEELNDGHWKTIVDEDEADLCPQCIEKRETDRSATYEETMRKAEPLGT